MCVCIHCLAFLQNSSGLVQKKVITLGFRVSSGVTFVLQNYVFKCLFFFFLKWCKVALKSGPRELTAQGTELSWSSGRGPKDLSFRWSPTALTTPGMQ